MKNNLFFTFSKDMKENSYFFAFSKLIYPGSIQASNSRSPWIAISRGKINKCLKILSLVPQVMIKPPLKCKFTRPHSNHIIVQPVPLLIACLLSLELFILGVQANKLHFCNLELILDKTGYSHITENKKISFSNMGTS